MISWPAAVLLAQRSSRKPNRSKPPVFEKDQFSSIFFEDAASTLKGELPSQRASVQLSTANPDLKNGKSTEDADADSGPMAWSNLIKPVVVEDLIKGAKLRLENTITSPAAFAGGGFATARTEFSLLALLFAIIEQHPKDDIRFKKSSGIAREQMARVAANCKVGSAQTFKEAKLRLDDLRDLVNGVALSGEPKSEVDWSGLIDRAPLMKLLKWAQQDHLNRLAANEAEFKNNGDDLARYAQLIAILGKASLAEEMPDATDTDYQGFATQMIEQAKQITLAVETSNPALARQAAAQLGQSCQDCHDNFR
ncbi:MAG: hypothetical protein AAGG44_18275 [Planctomycetota bacterium]